MTVRGRPPNVVLVVFDCARAKSLTPFEGGRVARTPHLGRLAAGGTIFSRAVAPGNWTLPSHMSLFTGAYPWTHGLRTFRPGAPQLPKIASWLSGRGYDTALFTEEVHLVAGYGLEEGYTTRVAPRRGTSDEERTPSNRLLGHAGFVYSPAIRALIERVPRAAIPLSAMNFRQEAEFKEAVCGSFLLDRFKEWLAQRRPERPFHAFFNFVDGHEPYPELVTRPRLGLSAEGFVQVPRFYLLAVPGLKERVPWSAVEAAYLRSLERADAKLGDLLESLDRQGELGRTIVIVTSDHGQSFGEGGNVYHGCGATDSVLRVPLVVRLDEDAARVPRVDRWMSLCEVSSWIKSAALGEPPYGPDGLAPVPFPAQAPDPTVVFGEGGPASDPNRSLEGIGPDQRWNHRLVAAYREDSKWVWDIETEGVWRFPCAGDPDRAPAETLAGAERDQALRGVFGVQRPEDVAKYWGGTTGPLRPPLADARIRSWGYD
jgi:hypothetical protein